MQFTLMFGTQLWVIMIFFIGCAATSSVAALYLLYNWKQLSGVAADGRENQRYHVDGVSSFQDQAAVTMALIGAPDLVSVHAPENMAFMYMNAAWRTIGYSASTLRGALLSTFVHEEDMPVLDAMLQHWNTTRTHEDVVREYRIRTAAHTYIHVESCCRWGELDVSAITDVRLTRNIEERIARTERTVAVRCEWMRIETSRAHTMTLALDLRAPLALLQLNVEFVRNSFNLPTEDIKEMLGR
eukprot:4848-Heterococcus_DN1.PRE.1